MPFKKNSYSECSLRPVLVSQDSKKEKFKEVSERLTFVSLANQVNYISQYYYMASIRFDESHNLIGQFEVRPGFSIFP